MIEFRRILCPVDFSKATASALRPATALAEAYGADLFFVHVLDFPYETVALERYYLEVEDEADRRLTALSHEVSPQGVRIHAAVLRGTPYERIVDFAEEQSIDLIVTATHGRRGIDRLVVGSVAERIARLAPCPVLTVPPGDDAGADFRPDRIIFATDFSAAADSAMPFAMSLCRQLEARLTVVHVVTMGERGDYGADWSFPLPPEAVREQQVSEATAGLQERGAGAEPGVDVDTRLIRGIYPAVEIADFAGLVDAGVIVVASHGHSAIGRALLGSTTEKLIRYSEVPVLSVRSS